MYTFFACINFQMNLKSYYISYASFIHLRLSNISPLEITIVFNLPPPP